MFDVTFWLTALRVLHVFAAIILVGFIVFNALVLQPALNRIPPAQATVIAQKVGSGLLWWGTGALIILGLTGFVRLWLIGNLANFFSVAFLISPYGRWVWLMALAWLVLFVVGLLSAHWYLNVLSTKLEYSAGLRDLEEKRQEQERVTWWQDRLYYVNVVTAFLAALGGAMARFY
ncbi:MAG: hypothetical protein ACREQJ_11485 [Candidatus Binatia bacterium]